ncbi:MAG: hypothetical protein CL681_27660 [Blastopirellula sp.]|nr:hypothetical protein [Blastopirellula sp.]
MQRLEFTLADAVRGILERKRIVFGIFFITLVVVGVATLLTPKEYYSEAKLFARVGRENAGIDPTATLGETPVISMPFNREAEINSYVELLKSKQLLEQVVDDIGVMRVLKRGVQPTTDGENAEPTVESRSMIDHVMAVLGALGVTNNVPLRERAVLSLRKNIDVKPVDKSHVLSVTYETHSPELAQEVVNTLIDAYLENHASLHRTNDGFNFLKEQTDAIRRELETAEDALKQLKNRSGLLSIDGARDVQETRLASIDNDLLKAEAAAASLATEVAALEDRMQQLPQTKVVASKTGAGNDGVDGMRQQLYTLELERNALLARHKPTHPLVTQVERRVAQAKASLAAEEAKRTENTTGPNVVYEQTNSELILKRAELAAQQSRIKTLESQRETVSEAAQEFIGDEIEYARLARLISIKDADYRKYAQNLAQAKIDHDLELESISNIEIAQPATLNLKPSYPDKLVNLIAGIALGIFNGLGVAVWLEYRRGSRQRSGSTGEAESPERPTETANGPIDMTMQVGQA